MSGHTKHPPIVEGGLADNCDRCWELAHRPLDLDDESLVAEWQQMVRVQIDHTGQYRSTAEAVACHRLHTMHVGAQRIQRLLNPTEQA